MSEEFGDVKENGKDQEKDLNEKEDLKKQIEQCEKLKGQYLEGWQRTMAEFLNYKKEETERIGKILEYSIESLILKILPVLDSFELAEKKIPEDLREKNEYVKGLLQIKKQLEAFLETQGVKKMECLGEKFNPRFHEIVEEVKVEGKEELVIIEEVEKGYFINNKILRPAKVKITK